MHQFFSVKNFFYYFFWINRQWVLKYGSLMSKLLSVFGHVLSILLQLIIFFYFFYFQKNLIGNVLSFISSNSCTCISFNTSLNLNLKFFFCGCVRGWVQSGVYESFGLFNNLQHFYNSNSFTIQFARIFIIIIFINHECVCIYICVCACVCVCMCVCVPVYESGCVYFSKVSSLEITVRCAKFFFLSSGKKISWW